MFLPLPLFQGGDWEGVGAAGGMYLFFSLY